MAKIMLLDDSPVMHRVVKLTFADDPQIEISVARTPDEVEQVIAGTPVDLIIAYARFSGESDVGYFEALSFVAPRLLLLAEDDEDMDPFVKAGFSAILRKPFHSDELRQVVDGLLSGDSDGRARHVAEPRRLAPTPPPAPRSSAPTPPPAPRSSAPTPPPAPRSGAPTPPPAPRSGAPTPPPAPRSGAPTPPPAPRSGAPTPPPARSIAPEVNDGDTPFSSFEVEPAAEATRQRRPTEFGNSSSADDEDTKELNHLSMNAKKAASKNQAKISDGGKNELQITLDLSGLKQQAFSHSPHSTKQLSPFSDDDDFDNGMSFSSIDRASERPTLKSALSASIPGASRRGIEPVSFDDTPMAIEDVRVTPREGSQRGVESHTFQLSQDDVEKLVEEKVAIAVSRAVRQALNETIPELRQGVVNEVSQRAVEQLSGELREIRQSLRDAVTGELKELSSQWLRRETPSLAKDVIREEIRRVIENI